SEHPSQSDTIPLSRLLRSQDTISTDQFSDTGPSSQLLNDPPDLSSIFSDDQSLLYETFDSQRTTTSLPVSEFLTPTSAPIALERGGPPNQKTWVIRTEMNKAEFIQWWVQTQAEETTKRIRWDAKRTSDVWDNFDQVAHFVTGEPKVLCRKCGKTLPHPQSTSNRTNSMKRHMSAGLCQRNSKNNPRQQNIQESLESAV
ncbi:unnamed protein product, partial [Penicillium salamii]